MLRGARWSALQQGLRKYLPYALGEIVLVMIGILLALQVNNANVARGERARETKYLRNIRIDLAKDLDSLKRQIEWRERRSGGIATILDRMDGKPSASLGPLASAVMMTLYEERFTPSNVTVSDLISSGNMNLVSDDAIKERLFQLEALYRDNDFYVEHETYEYREFISKPICALARIDRLKPVFLGQKTAEEMGLSAEEFAPLLASDAYRNGCVVAQWVGEDLCEFYRSVEALSREVIERIDVALR